MNKKTCYRCYLNTEKLLNDIQVCVNDYAQYILREGSPKAKHDLLQTLSSPKKIHNKILYNA